MKKILLLALAAMALTVACKKETTTEVYKVDTLEAEGLSPLSIIIKGEMSPDLWRTSSKIQDLGFYWGNDPANLDQYIDGEHLAKGVFTATLTDLAPHSPIWYKAYCSVMNMDFYGEPKSFTTSSFDEVVDLGLSVKWRAWNLGASSPEEFGDYYAWGEVETYYTSFNPLIWKDDKSKGYSWESYSFSSYNGEYTTFTQYCTSSEYGNVDFKTMLQTGPDGNDIASILLGGNWRMPTNREIDELINNCSIETFTIGGINGSKLSSNKPGFTDKWIFFPRSGFFDDVKYFSGAADYWSSEVDADDPRQAFCLELDSPDKKRESYCRCWGFNIRPVLADAPPVAVTGVSIDQTSLKMKVGQTIRLNSTVSPSNATDHTVVWTSSSPQIAKVDTHGNVYALAPGNASIYAGAGGVNTEKCEVEVTE